MARKPRLISAPPAKGGNIENGWSQLSGTMGALSPDQGPIGNIPAAPTRDTTFEAPEDLNYDHMIAEREAALGLPAGTNGVSGAAHYAPIVSDPGRFDRDLSPYENAPHQEHVDLTPLPDKFELVIERKGSSWKVTSPLHVGLWRAGDRLAAVIEEALGALAMMIAVDGPKPKGRRK